MENNLYLGIDIGGTTIKAGVINNENEIIFRKSIPTESHLAMEKIFHRICVLIDEFLFIYPDIISIGFGIPGVVNSFDNILVAPNFPYCENVDIGKYFRSKYDYPIAFDNDANAAALAELHAGNGKNEDNFIYITLGTGVGGAIIIDGQIYKGKNGGAGEIGHIVIDKSLKNSPLSYRCGILEEIIGRSQIIELAQNMLDKNHNSILYGKDFDVLDISKAASLNDEIAISCLKQTGEYLGIAITSVANFMDIPLFIIGGGISQAHDILLDTALDFVRKHALPSIAGQIQIRPAKFLHETGIIGAALSGKYKL